MPSLSNGTTEEITATTTITTLSVPESETFRVWWDLLLNSLLLLLYLRNLQKANILRQQTRILSHHMAIFLSFCGIFQTLVYITLYTLDSACSPVLSALTNAGILASISVFAILLLRVYHSHGNPRWVLVIGILLIFAQLYGAHVIRRDLEVFIRGSVCSPRWPRATVVTRLRIELISEIFLIAAFATAKLKDGWMWSSAAVGTMMLGSVLQGLRWFDAHIGALWIVSFALTSTLVIELLGYAQMVRRALARGTGEVPEPAGYRPVPGQNQAAPVLPFS